MKQLNIMRWFSSPMRGSCFQYAYALELVKYHGYSRFSSPMRGSCFQFNAVLNPINAVLKTCFRPLCGEAVFNP